ncbi:MAG: hypothetical protein LBG74_08805, partial [Spirochaetaceae bacterium]|nr:hypothetical protein [Spirochaetaceae bacterium]
MNNAATLEKQRRYNELIKKYEISIKTFQKTEVEVLAECRAHPETAACKLFNLAEGELDAASCHLVINGISVAVLGMKSEEALNDARKALSKAIIYVENVVTNMVNTLFSDYEEALKELSEISAEKKLYFIRKTGLTIDLTKLAYGETSRWKWAFIDIEGRFAAIAKNLLDLRKAQSNESKNPDYIPVSQHTKLVKQLLDKAATNYIERYELSTQNADDIMTAVNFISVLERIKILLNDNES